MDVLVEPDESDESEEATERTGGASRADWVVFIVELTVTRDNRERSVEVLVRVETSRAGDNAEKSPRRIMRINASACGVADSGLMTGGEVRLTIAMRVVPGAIAGDEARAGAGAGPACSTASSRL